MNRYREFRGTFTRMEYDGEHGTFEWVAEVHPFLASMGAGVEIAADPQVENFIPTRVRGAIEAANPVCADYLLDPSGRFLIWDRATGMPVATNQGILVFLTEEEAIAAINLLNSSRALPVLKRRARPSVRTLLRYCGFPA